MTTLKRTFSLTEIDNISEAVAYELNLDVPWRFDVFLNIDRWIVKAGSCFGACERKAAGALTRRTYQAHPLTAASGGCFEHHRIANFTRYTFGLFDRVKW